MSPEQIADLRRQRYNATVVHLEKLHSDLMVIRVRPDFPRPAHKPGQYCTLGLGNWEPRADGCQPETLTADERLKVVRRSYSLSCSVYSDPAAGTLRDLSLDDWVEFYIVLVRESPPGTRVPALTPRLFTLKVGDRVQLGERVVGHFTLDAVQPGDNVVFLGTGTGEAPHNYMLWQLLSRGHAGRMLSACCVRYQRDLGYLDIHRRLAEQFPRYRYLPLTTREPGRTRKPYIQDVLESGELEDLLGAKLDPANTHVFLCGNPKMIGVPVKDPLTGGRQYPEPVGVIELLERRGFTADNAALKVKGTVHFEEYW
jgi:ferredoxin--NADP+ reductase